MLTCPLFLRTVFHNSALMKILEATSLPLKGILENQQEWKNPCISEIQTKYFLKNINFNHVIKIHYFYPWVGEVQNKEDKCLPTEITVS